MLSPNAQPINYLDCTLSYNILKGTTAATITKATYASNYYGRYGHKITPKADFGSFTQKLLEVLFILILFYFLVLWVYC
jgi:hypothetical protein